MNILNARRQAARRLAEVSETPGFDADVLLAYVLDTNRAGLVARGREQLPSVALERYQLLVERRLEGEPVAYITGTKAFRMIELAVDERVLVPRPETELLIDVALLALREMQDERRVLDVGTGSGAIALALAWELRMAGREDVSVVASDISQQALDVARTNRRRLGLDALVETIQADLLDGVKVRFDVILANLPYLRPDQRHPSTAREPESALYAGPDGMDLYRRLFEQAPVSLTPDGIVACEIDPDQATMAVELAERCLAGGQVVLKDLAGRERVLVAGAVDIVRTVAETFEHGARSG